MKEVHLYENTKISTEGNTCTYSMLTCQTICSLVAELLTLNLTLNYGKMYCRHFTVSQWGCFNCGFTTQGI